ncbi:restriction endonuclease subunit S [Morganella morganii]|nr:restriction endonuclease subunit S [Morganella morganii]
MTKYKAYPEYKDSGVEWLGEIPAHWEMLRHKYVAFFTKGKNPINLFEQSLNNTLPYLSMECLRNNITDKYALISNDIRIAVEGQPLIIWDGSNAGEFVKGKSGILSSTMAAATLILPFNSQYYWYLCIAIEPEMRKNAIGMGIPHVNGDELKNISFGIPPIYEQRKISSFLDDETTKIDNLIEKQQQLIELLKEKRQAVISHAVTKGLNPDVPMKDSGNDLLGKMPVHWKLTPMRFLSDNITVGIVVTPAKYYIDNGIRCFRSLNISEGKIKDAEWVYISEASNNLLSKSKVYTDDILVVRSGQPGTAAVVDHEFDSCNCIDLIIIRSSERFNSNYICMQINSVFIKKQVGMASDGAIQQHFNVEVAKALVVVEPPKHEQSEIFKFLSEKNKYFERLIERSELQITLLQERRTALISAAVTGKIDVRDWVAPDTQEIEKTEETAA